MNTLFKIIHSINMLHPEHINITKKNHLFEFTVKLVTKKRSFIVKNLVTAFFKCFGNIFNRKLVDVFKIILFNKPALVFFFKAAEVPVCFMSILCTVNRNIFLNA